MARRRDPKKYVIALAVIVAIVAVVLIILDQKRQGEMQLTAGEDVYVGTGFRDVTWNGDHYRFNNRITAILVAGIDSFGDVGATATYTMAPRADNIQLVILNQLTHKMKILALNRDTMTEIRKFALDGMDRGLMKDHLALAFTYGNGGDVSCRNLCEAVSMLLYNIPIRDYVVVNRSSLETLAELVGPVEVIVPNNDLAEINSGFQKGETEESEEAAGPDDNLGEINSGFREGETVVIDASNLESYVQSRDITVEKSNLGRMQRQQSYITAAMEQLLTRVRDNPSRVWKDLQKAEDCMLTSLNRSRYLDLVNILQDVTYDDEDYLIPEGEQVKGEFYEEFYPDQAKLLELIIDLFYIKQS